LCLCTGAPASRPATTRLVIPSSMSHRKYLHCVSSANLDNSCHWRGDPPIERATKYLLIKKTDRHTFGASDWIRFWCCSACVRSSSTAISLHNSHNKHDNKMLNFESISIPNCNSKMLNFLGSILSPFWIIALNFLGNISATANQLGRSWQGSLLWLYPWIFLCSQRQLLCVEFANLLLEGVDLCLQLSFYHDCLSPSDAAWGEKGKYP